MNEAREKLEEIIDVLHEPYKGKRKKVRTYREKARKDYLKVAKKPRASKKQIRVGIRKQLQYIGRDLRYIKKLSFCKDLGRVNPLKKLNNRMYKNLLVISELYRQQKSMYERRSHKIADRIVSISQPHVRPIVRGKANAEVEFGAKLSVAMVDGYAFLEKISWDAFNEGGELKRHIENYRLRFGYYPASIHVDKIYRNRENRAYCKERGIQISGLPLGRPPKATKEYKRLLKSAKESEIERIPIEGKFGNAKRKYGWSKIRSKLRTTSESSIAMTVLVMNLEKILRDLLLSIFSLLHRLGFSRFNRLIFT